jgi:hypothetical protein
MLQSVIIGQITSLRVRAPTRAQWRRVGGALYQINPALPCAVVAAMYLLPFVSMRWIGRRVAVHESATAGPPQFT